MKDGWKSPFAAQFDRAAVSNLKIAAVSFFNSRPLLEGLDNLPQVEIARMVPSQCLETLEMGLAQAAILPAIDLQRSRAPLTVLPAGCISSSGTVLTVRIFSQVRPAEIDTLWTDTDSHCSVALAQVLWYYQFKRRLRIIPFSPGRWEAPETAQAVMLIGDKVVTRSPIGYNFQFDLGRMWFEMTGLPFVFAVWAANEDAPHAELNRLLACARRDGQDNLYDIARKYAPLYDWPMDLAHRYLTTNLCYDFTDAHREGLDEFFALAADMGLINPLRKVRYFEA